MDVVPHTLPRRDVFEFRRFAKLTSICFAVGLLVWLGVFLFAFPGSIAPDDRVAMLRFGFYFVTGSWAFIVGGMGITMAMVDVSLRRLQSTARERGTKP